MWLRQLTIGRFQSSFHSCIVDWSAFQAFFDSSRWWVISWPLRCCIQSDSGVEVMVTSSWHHHSEEIRTRDFMEISCMIEYWYFVTDRSEYRQRTVSRLCSILVRLNCGVVGEVHVNDSCCWYLIRRSFQGTRLRSVPVIDYRWTLVYLLRTTEVIRSDHLSDVLVARLLRELLPQSSLSSSYRHRLVGDRFVQSYYRSQVTSTVDCDC